MFGSAILDVAIGIVFVFILVSIICSTLREGIEAWLKTRAAYLEQGIRELLNDEKGEGLAQTFYQHPLIYTLFSGKYQPRDLTRGKLAWLFANGTNLPSYIPAKNFATVLMDIAARGPDPDIVSSDANAPIVSLSSIRNNILNIQNKAVQRVLLTAIDSAQGDFNKAQANIEAWYDSAMDRVSGWYKRSTHWIIFWIGLFVAIALNINTITLVEYLYRNDTDRAILVVMAEKASTDTTFLEQNYDQANQKLSALNLPIGWSSGWGTPQPDGAAGDIWSNVFEPILGWLLTAFAATLGAPFWFDVLNKIMVIRSTVKPHEKSPEEASEDRQLPRGNTVEPRVEAPSDAAQPGKATPNPPDKDR